MILLSESGLNLALMRSRTEIGKRMRLWLAREVLPSIRRTGSYTVNDTAPSSMAETIATAMRDALAPLAEHMRALANRVEAIETTSSSGVIGRDVARAEIRQRYTRAARISAGGDRRVFASVVQKYETRIRAMVPYPRARGHRWESLPRELLGRAKLAVEQIERDAEDLSAARNEGRQTAMSFARPS